MFVSTTRIDNDLTILACVTRSKYYLRLFYRLQRNNSIRKKNNTFHLRRCLPGEYKRQNVRLMYSTRLTWEYTIILSALYNTKLHDMLLIYIGLKKKIYTKLCFLDNCTYSYCTHYNL